MKEEGEIALLEKNISDLQEVVDTLLELSGGMKIWIFTGDLGAGKTTLIKEICKQLGVEGLVSSPSFSIINEYQSYQGEEIYHFDFYRLNDESEAIQIGVEEYFYSGNLCLVEWPEKASSFIPDEYVHIKVEPGSNNTRNYYLTKNV